MQMSASTVDGILSQAAAILQRRDREHLDLLDAIAVPIYATDAEGVITYFNPACIEFAGRTPAINQDRWCITWKLYTDEGEFLPHDQCPMARALQGEQPIRSISAIAERPDGTRLNFMPFPTPLFDKNGALTGAINLFVDVTAEKKAAQLRAEAARCRRWALFVSDKRTLDTLDLLAAEYEEKARRLDAEPN
jgi:PAS domain S-box-containing protein